METVTQDTKTRDRIESRPVRIREDVWEVLRVRAFQDRVPMTAILDQALRQYLDIVPQDDSKSSDVA